MRTPCALLAAALLLAGIASADAYSCDAATCVAPNCKCASTSPPGGLAATDIPMFILLTHDDSVSTLQNRVVRTVTDGFKNPNGCNVPATWFALKDKSNCTMIQDLVKDNHEIAGHTMNHAYMYANLTAEQMKAEVEGIKQYVTETCKIPVDKFKGFRAPYLVHNEQLRNVLSEAGYEYDASIMEPTNTVSSPSWAQRTFPYTFDAGSPQDCNWPGAPEMSCSTTEKHPGLWEVPVWMLPSLTAENGFTMDPEAVSADEMYQLLKKSFDEAYAGNRAPFPVFLHAPWFTYDNTAGLLQFMKYASEQPNTWFVTMSQLINWMKNPVPASQVASQLTCNMVELTPPTLDWCRQYKVGLTEDIWTVGAKWGVSTDEALMAVNEGIINKRNQWNLPEGLVVNLPPWDARCEQPGAAFFPSADWYTPVYSTTPAAAAPSAAPSTAPSAVPTALPATIPVATYVAPAGEAAPTAATIPAPAPAPAAAAVEVPAAAPMTAAAPTTAAPVLAVGNSAPAPLPLDTRVSSGASSAVGNAGALILAGLAAVCLLL